VGKHKGKRPLGRTERRWKDNIKVDIIVMGCGAWSRSDMVTGGYECGSQLTGSINCGDFLEQLIRCLLGR
jgi:hypothetical protein